MIVNETFITSYQSIFVLTLRAEGNASMDLVVPKMFVFIIQLAYGGAQCGVLLHAAMKIRVP
jgi:hypothetical protein